MQSRFHVAVALALPAVILTGCGESNVSPTNPPNGGINPESGAKAGDFESYVLAFEWQAQWSQQRCQSETARQLSKNENAMHSLSVHGMWPNYKPEQHSGHTWPQFCEKYLVCESDFDSSCLPDPATVAAHNVSTDWQMYAMEYAWGTLSGHEWAKHGSCVGVNASQYFSAIKDKMYALASQGPVADFFSANVGKNVTYDDATSKLSQGAVISISCDNCYLSDVWFAYKASNQGGALLPDLSSPIDYLGPDTSCNVTRCPAGIHIRNWTSEGCHSRKPLKLQ